MVHKRYAIPNDVPTSMNGTVHLCEMDAWLGLGGIFDEEIPRWRKFTTVVAVRREILNKPGEPFFFSVGSNTG
jgi:hypothetical protein